MINEYLEGSPVKKRIIPLLTIMVFVLLVGCGKGVSSSKPQIVVSLYPLQDFAKKIGGPYVDVVNLVPPGTEPHNFEPTPQDMITISKAKLFVYNGAGLESWVDHILPNLDQNQTLVINTVQHLQLHKATRPKNFNKVTDPHIWLDPYLAQQQANAIYKAMIQIDPKHKQAFTANYQRLNQQFEQLKSAYTNLLYTPIRDFVTSHAAFGYLAERYHLNQISVSGISPEDEPSPKQLKKLIDTLRQHNVKVVFFETLVNNKLADAVKNEIHAKAEILNPLEGLSNQEITQGDDYFSVMMKNLDNLKKALGTDHG